MIHNLSMSLYKIINKTTDECIYIGSSFQINNRVNTHLYNSKNYCSKPLYQYINDNGGWDLFEFVIFQEYTNVEKKFLLSKEREYIELYKPRFNINRPIITEKERNYRENTKERKEQKREYYKKNLEHLKEKYREYYEKNSEHIKEKYRDSVKLSAIRAEYPNILAFINTLENSSDNLS